MLKSIYNRLNEMDTNKKLIILIVGVSMILIGALLIDEQLCPKEKRTILSYLTNKNKPNRYIADMLPENYY